MSQEWLLKDLTAAYIVFRWRPLREDEKAYEHRPSFAIITSWLDNMQSQASIREMYESAFGAAAGALDGNRKKEIARKLEDAFQSRILVCLRATRVTPGANSQKEDAPAPPVAPPPRPAKNKTWIAIELVDDKGKPVAGERYRIETPDGSREEDHLDAEGRARIDNLDHGECQISFPDIDGREWGPA